MISWSRLLNDVLRGGAVDVALNENYKETKGGDDGVGASVDVEFVYTFKINR